MTHLTDIVALFFAELGLGSAIVFPFFPARVTGKSFVRFYYGFILVVLSIFLYCLTRLNQYNHNYLIVVLLGAWIWLISFLQEFSRIEEFLHKIFAVFALALLLIYAEKFVFHGLDYLAILPLVFALVTGTVFLAYYVMNMIFAHWYLVNRTLGMAHLIRSSWRMIALSWLRTAAVGVSSYQLCSEDPEQFARLTAIIGHGIFFWLRVLAGLGIPITAAHLAYASAKIGANQSATGIMYAGTVFVLMGEMLGLYLMSLTGYFL